MTHAALWVASAVAGVVGPADLGGADLILADGDTIAGDLTGIGHFEIPEGAAVASTASFVSITATTIVVGGTLRADSEGYGAWSGPGAPTSWNGPGPGGGHGGRGGDALGGGGGVANGSPSLDLPSAGSGGASGTFYQFGGSGGGYIGLTASSSILLAPTGTVSALGGKGEDDTWGWYWAWGGGGGAGGGLRLDAPVLDLKGTISVGGGSGGVYSVGPHYCQGVAAGGGGGGGGIVALVGHMRSLPSIRLDGGDAGPVDWYCAYGWVLSGETGTVYWDISDADADRVDDRVDNCVATFNPMQADADADGVGDTCDDCPFHAFALGPECPEQDAEAPDCLGDPSAGDADGDGLCDDLDACAGDDATGDDDDDGTCGDLDRCPGFDDGLDIDVDGLPDDCDLCPSAVSPMNADVDGDGAGDDCDPCPFDASDDSDQDGICDVRDDCVGEGLLVDDLDGDAICGTEDACPATDGNPYGEEDCSGGSCGCLDDHDKDGVIDSQDQCPGYWDHLDADLDGLPDACDACPLDVIGQDDLDGDGLCNAVDPCIGGLNGYDEDGDGVCDDFDPCYGASGVDSDGDDICDDLDPCLGTTQVDRDEDGVCDELAQAFPLDEGAGLGVLWNWPRVDRPPTTAERGCGSESCSTMGSRLGPMPLLTLGAAWRFARRRRPRTAA